MTTPSVMDEHDEDLDLGVINVHEARPTISPVRQPTRSFGSTGLKGAASGMLYEEFLPALRQPTGPSKYKEMVDNDPVIGGIMYVMIMMLRRVKWTVAAADDSAQAEAFRHWLETVYFNDMSMSFGSVVENALQKLIYGFMPTEVIYKIRQGFVTPPGPRPGESDLQWAARKEREEETPNSRYDDRTIGVDKISPRPPDTIWRWFFDPDGDWFALLQHTEQKGGTIIPRSKIALFRNSFFKNNPEGRSVLRSSWVPYERKKALEIAEGRIAQRASGIAVIEAPGDIVNPEPDDARAIQIRAELDRMVNKLAKDQQGGLLISSDVDDVTKAKLYAFHFVTPDLKSAVDISKTIERYDHRIAISMSSAFILLGGSNTGSFAMSKEMTEMLNTVTSAQLDEIEEELHESVTKPLWAINNFDPKFMPRLKHGPVARKDIEAMGAFLSKLTASGADIFPNPPLLNELLADTGLQSGLTPDLEAITYEEKLNEASASNAIQQPQDGTTPDKNLEDVK